MNERKHRERPEPPRAANVQARRRAKGGDGRHSTNPSRRRIAARSRQATSGRTCSRFACHRLRPMALRFTPILLFQKLDRCGVALADAAWSLPSSRLVLRPGISLATLPPSFISVTSVGLGSTRTWSYQDDSVQMNSCIRPMRWRTCSGALLVGGEPLGQFGKQRDGRVDLAPLALGGDAQQHLPQVGLGGEMVAPVALDMHARARSHKPAIP